MGKGDGCSSDNEMVLWGFKHRKPRGKRGWCRAASWMWAGQIPPREVWAVTEGLHCNFSSILLFITHIPLLYSPSLPIISHVWFKGHSFNFILFGPVKATLIFECILIFSKYVYMLSIYLIFSNYLESDLERLYLKENYGLGCFLKPKVYTQSKDGYPLPLDLSVLAYFASTWCYYFHIYL